MQKLSNIKRWFKTPPDENDFFFTTIRKIIQKLFPCKHEWEKIEDYRRKCIWCEKVQFMVYHEFGPIRTEWCDYPRWLFKNKEPN